MSVSLAASVPASGHLQPASRSRKCLRTVGKLLPLALEGTLAIDKYGRKFMGSNVHFHYVCSTPSYCMARYGRHEPSQGYDRSFSQKRTCPGTCERRSGKRANAFRPAAWDGAVGRCRTWSSFQYRVPSTVTCQTSTAWCRLLLAECASNIPTSSPSLFSMITTDSRRIHGTSTAAEMEADEQFDWPRVRQC